MPVVRDYGVVGAEVLEFEIAGCGGPVERFLAVLAHAGMDGSGVISFALVGVDGCDGVGKGYADSESLVFGEDDCAVFAESVFDFWVR